MIKRFETFTYAISEISQSWNKIASAEMKSYGLKGAYAIYLVALSHYEEGITAAKLSEISNKDKADISRAVSIMEKKGLIERENTAKNAYRALIKLTPEGKKAAFLVGERAKAAVEAGGRGISEENRAIFYSTLQKIAENLKTIIREGLPK